MKFFKSMLVLLLICSQASSQVNTEVGKYKISGRITDSISGQPLEKATLTITEQKSGRVINRTISDNQGLFSFSDIPPGTYILSAEFIGYSPYIKRNLTVTSESNQSIVEDVVLSKKGVVLQNIVVTGSKTLLENKIDRIIYNVDKDITSQGGVATDALRKIPGVTVDIDGNVELLGNPSVRFLIDGKPSGIFGNSVADALQSIPASQIQSIEVMTSPGAKYDAAGTGGIINIILRKSKVEGFNGNLNLSAGSRLENGSLSTNWHQDNFGVNFFYSGNVQLPANTPASMDRITNKTATAPKSRLLQETNADFGRNGHKAGIGLDWNISKMDNFSIAIGYTHFANRTNGNTNQSLIQYDDADNELSHVNSLRNTDTKIYINSFDNSVTYKRKFKKEGQELEIAYEGSFEKNNTFYNQSQHYKTTNTPFAGSNSLNPGIENETNFSIDYVHPLKEKWVLESGFKTTFQSIVSNANVFTLNPASGNYVWDEKQSYTSDYHRRIYAGYLSFTFSLFNFLDIKAGGRIEHTISHALYSNAPKTAIPSYNNIAPSFIISHSFSNTESLKFAYSYRLERPDYRDLNPFMNLSDPHNITTGNPNLQPEIGHNFELSYNKSFEKGATINLVLFYQKKQS